MEKTWELFVNHSNFMKFLLIEVLSPESVESSEYIRNALIELFIVFVNFIQKLKIKSISDSTSINATMSDRICKAVSDILKSEDLSNSNSSETNELVSVAKNNYTISIGENEMKCKSSDAKSSLVPEELHEISKVDQNIHSNSDKTIIIPPKFHNFSNGVSKLRFGSYCNFCNIIFMREDQWNEHLKYKHFNLIEGNMVEKCDECCLTVLGGGSELITYHQLNHCFQKATGTNKTSELYCQHFYGSSLKVTGDMVIYNDVVIEKEFIELSNSLHLKNITNGFYCKPCLKCFEHGYDWADHFNNDVSHRTKMMKSKSKYVLQSCDNCNLIMYSIEKVANTYILFHKVLHKSNISKRNSINEVVDPVKERTCQKETSFPPSENNCSNIKKKFSRLTCSDEFKFRSYCHFCDFVFYKKREWKKHINFRHGDMNVEMLQKCDHCNLIFFVPNFNVESYVAYHKSLQGCTDIKTKKRHVVKRINVAREFILFSDQVHENNCEGYYCLPCKVSCFTYTEWSQHCKDKIHCRKIRNVDYENVKLKCCNCDFILIGSRNYAIEYINYHNLRHNENKANTAGYISLEHFTKKLDKLDNSGKSWASFCSTSCESVHPHTVTHTSASYASSCTSIESDEVNFICIIQKRETQKKNGLNFSFEGMCLLCEINILDFFDWTDHVEGHEKNEHYGEVSCLKCNVYIFGNKCTIQRDFIQSSQHKQLCLL